MANFKLNDSQKAYSEACKKALEPPDSIHCLSRMSSDRAGIMVDIYKLSHMEKPSANDGLRDIAELMDQMPEFVKQFPNPKQYEETVPKN